MKKIRFLGVLAALFLGFSLVSCTKGDNVNTSEVNKYEDDARYEIYLKALNSGAFDGTYEEWLETIKGEDGSSFISGMGTPTADLGNLGDTYIDTQTWDMYTKTKSGWTKVGNIQGEEGQKGDKGDPGDDGISVVSIEKTSTNGNVDTYTITYSDNTTSTFTVTNGVDGKDGIQGIQGEPGKDGHTPVITIGENGNWFVDGVDSGFSSKGENGKSAYEIYIEYHPEYTGDEQQWIEDLVNGNLSQKEEGTDGLVYYPLPDGTYAVGGGTTMYLTEIVIPSTYNGKSVTVIAKNAFENFTNLENITIPDTITSIDEMAFNNCKNLKYLIIPESVTNFVAPIDSIIICTNTESIPTGWGWFNSQNYLYSRVLLKGQWQIIDNEVHVISSNNINQFIEKISNGSKTATVSGTIVRITNNFITIADDENLENTLRINLNPEGLNLNDTINLLGTYWNDSYISEIFTKTGTGNFNSDPIVSEIKNVLDYSKDKYVTLNGTITELTYVEYDWDDHFFILSNPNNYEESVKIKYDYYAEFDFKLTQQVTILGYVNYGFIELESITINGQDNNYASSVKEIYSLEDQSNVVISATITAIYNEWNGTYIEVASKEDNYDTKLIIDYKTTDNAEEVVLPFEISDIVLIKGTIYSSENQAKHLTPTYIEKIQEDEPYYYPLNETQNLETDWLINVRGTVASIDKEWNDNYGTMDVTIVDEYGNSLILYRLKTQVKLNDYLEVNGKTKVYTGAQQIYHGTATIIEENYPLPTFDINIESSTGGTIIPNMETENLPYNTSVTFIIYYSEGYTLEYVKVNGEIIQVVDSAFNLVITKDITIESSFLISTAA